MSDESFSPRLEAMSTRWSVIQRAHGDQRPAALDARRVLVLRYAPAIKAYIRGMTKDEFAADELAQDIVVRLMEGDFAGADPGRGRFRDFLKTATRNMVRNFWARQNTRAASELTAETSGALADDTQGDSDPWETDWKNRILELTWQSLKQHDRANQNAQLEIALRLRAEFPDDSSDELAQRFGERIGQPIRADAFRQKLRRARVLFAECLVTELADGLAEPSLDQVEEELIALNLYDRVRRLLPEDWRVAQNSGEKREI
jgi:RNA polymerase sigma-70 factor (ECF subfamily)